MERGPCGINISIEWKWSIQQSKSFSIFILAYEIIPTSNLNNEKVQMVKRRGLVNCSAKVTFLSLFPLRFVITKLGLSFNIFFLDLKIWSQPCPEIGFLNFNDFFLQVSKRLSLWKVGQSRVCSSVTCHIEHKCKSGLFPPHFNLHCSVLFFDVQNKWKWRLCEPCSVSPPTWRRGGPSPPPPSPSRGVPARGRSPTQVKEPQKAADSDEMAS